jgi:hypothetical protein
VSSFYDEIMQELVLALGAALFLAYGLALVRRRSDARRAGTRSVAGSRARAGAHGENANDLAQAPLARTVTFMLIGLIVSVWALASIVTH